MARIVLTTLGLLLLVTAVSKLWLLLTDPFADLRSQTSLPVLWLADFAELAVLVVVLSRLPVPIKWLTTTSCFLVFALASAFNVWTGKSSCGCLGVVELNPIWFLAITWIALGMLLVVRPSADSIRRELKTLNMTSRTIGSVVGVAIIVALFALSQTGFVRSLVRIHWYGHYIQTTTSDFGRIQNTPCALDLVLNNGSSKACHIVGYQRSCSCVIPHLVDHAVIPPAGHSTICVHVKPPTSGRFHQRLVFFLDSPHQPLVVVDITGFLEEI